MVIFDSYAANYQYFEAFIEVCYFCSNAVSSLSLSLQKLSSCLGLALMFLMPFVDDDVIIVQCWKSRLLIVLQLRIKIKWTRLF